LKAREGGNLWWFEGVICREVDCEEEDTPCVWTVGLEYGQYYVGGREVSNDETSPGWKNWGGYIPVP